MGELFAYSLYSSLILAAMYLTYKWVLSGERQHGFNRAILLGIYVAAIVLPAFTLGFGGRVDATVVIDGVTVGFITEDAVEESPVSFSWAAVLLILYLAGIVVCLFHTALVAARLVGIVRRGEHVRLDGKYRLILTDDKGVAPFSWWRYVVMPRQDFIEYQDMILVHELKHLRASHWSDLLFAQCVAIFQWYNPAAWLMREELKTVHEYQADDAVMRAGTDMRSYQMLLIKKAVGTRFPSLANSLNHSKLKKRVNMMYKKSPSNGRRMRSIALVPAVLVALVAINVPAVGALIHEASVAEVPFPDDKGSEKSVNGKISISPAANKPVEKSSADKSLENMTVYIDGKKATVNEMQALDPAMIASMTVFKDSEIHITTNGAASEMKQTPKSKSDLEVQLQAQEMPRFPGGEAELMRYVAMNIKYPQEAMKAGKEGRVVVRFVVSADGKVTDPQIVRSIDKQLDDEALRVISSLPDFIPGKIDGKPVSVWYTMPVVFKLSKDGPSK